MCIITIEIEKLENDLKVINNGMTSNFFTLERGVRQGDPLSPYLFVVAVGTLAIAIRQNPEHTYMMRVLGQKKTRYLTKLFFSKTRLPLLASFY